MLLIVVCFGREIRVSHRFFVLRGRSVFLIVFLFWEGDPCFSSFFCFGRGVRVVHRFIFLCCDFVFVLWLVSGVPYVSG